jgi:hypothetical protein
MGYSTEDTESTAAIVVTLNGNTVYTGTVPTKDMLEWNRIATEQQVLFTLDVPSETTSVPMTITCTAGDNVDVGAIHANSSGTNADLSVFWPANMSVDSRQNVTLDSIAQERGPNAELFPDSGNWSYSIAKGSVLAYNLVVEA